MNLQRWGGEEEEEGSAGRGQHKASDGADRGAQRRVRLVRGKLFVFDRRYTNHVVA